MIVTVTPNPALDLTWRVPRIELGETHRVAAGAARAGGKGLNVARVLHQQGHAVLALATEGGATGAELTADLLLHSLPHLLIPVAAPTRRSIALYDEERDETSIFNELGANPTRDEWAALTAEVASVLPRARCLVVSGSVPPGAPEEFHPTLVALARAHGVPSVIDTSGPALVAAARAGASVVKPNRSELREATGEDDPVTAARMLIAFGAGLVLVSLGADGMIAVSRDEPDVIRRARLPEPLVGNPTGAGDAAVAAVAAAIADGRTDVEALLRTATAWSAAAVLMPLAGEISPDHAALAARLVITGHSGAIPSPRTQED